MSLPSNSIEIKASRRSRGVRVTVHKNGRVVVTKPLHAADARVEHFLRLQMPWIERKIAEYARTPFVSLVKPKGDYHARKEEARALVAERLTHLSAQYGFLYGSVSIRSQKSRWGSCSAKKNLSFNYKIVYLAPEEVDYIVMHELCHTVELNHGPRFWALVEQAIPEHRKIRRALRRFVLY